MNEVICSSCFEVEDTTKRFIELPYVCPACVKRREDARYHSGVPCQSSLDSECDRSLPGLEFLHDLVTRTAGDIRDAHRSDVPDQFDADTEVINDLRMQLDQANKNVQVQGEMIADLENTLGAYRAIFRIPGYSGEKMASESMKTFVAEFSASWNRNYKETGGNDPKMFFRPEHCVYTAPDGTVTDYAKKYCGQG
jgi:hypothetical protein